MPSNTPEFSSPEEALNYWKNLALEYKSNLEETREEFSEYQISSQELETELETQLEQNDKKYSDRCQQVNQLSIENDSLKERLASNQHDFSSHLTSVEDELTCIKTREESLAKYIRQLEQNNDDLERSKRTTVASLEDFESRLNSAIERNAFLESELDEKETLKEMVQRLKDEARDLRQEVNVKKLDDVPDNDVAMKQLHHKTILVDKKPSLMDSNKLITDVRQNSNKCHNNIHSLNGNGPMPPSARVSALNIVGDLLRKVGALETRVASCRTTLVKENQRPISLPTSGGQTR